MDFCKIGACSCHSVLHKFAFQVDTKIDVLTYDFSSRVAHWEKICEALEKEVHCFAVPVLTGGKNPPYFRAEMMGNQGKTHLSGDFSHGKGW